MGKAKAAWFLGSLTAGHGSLKGIVSRDRGTILFFILRSSRGVAFFFRL